MPRGPNGERRPASVVGCAVTVARIATGEDEETGYEQPQKRTGGRIGGRARAQLLSRDERSDIARRAADARWRKKKKDAETENNA